MIEAEKLVIKRPNSIWNNLQRLCFPKDPQNFPHLSEFQISGAMATSSDWLWFMRIFGVSLPYIIYQHVLFSLALHALLENEEESSCRYIPWSSLSKHCETFFFHRDDQLIKRSITCISALSVIIQWLNNFSLFNTLYKLAVSLALNQRGMFFEQLREMLYTSSAFKESGLVSCNPAVLCPALVTLKHGYLVAVNQKARPARGETMAEVRGVYRFVIGELDINIKTNQLASNPKIWHLESITNMRDRTDILLKEASSQQVNLLVRVLRKWEKLMPEVGVISETSQLMSLTVLHAMQLSEILEHILAGLHVQHVRYTKGVWAFVAGEVGIVKFKQKQGLEERAS